MKLFNLFVSLTVLAQFNTLIGQSTFLDSVIQVYEEVPVDSLDKKMTALTQVIRFSSRSNIELHEKYLSVYDSIAQKSDDTYYKGRSLVMYGTLDYFNDDYLAATEKFLQAIKVFAARNDNGQVGALYNNLSAISDRLGDKDQSLKHLTKGYEYYKLENNPHRIAIATGNLGYLLASMDSLDAAKAYVDTSLFYYEKAGEKIEIGNAYRVKAQILRAEKNFKEAIRFEKKALITTGSKYKSHKVAALCNLIELYLETNEINLAGQMIRRVEQEIDINTFPRQKRGFEQSLEKYYASIGQYAKAYDLSKSNQTIQDSIYSQEKDLAYNELLEKYESEKKEKEIIELNAKQASTKLQLASSKRTSWLLALSSLLLLGFVYTLFRLKNNITKQKDLLSISLKEKETLLKEIHHRVKNNLQVVSSLLFLQGRSTADHTVAEALQEGQNRVKSMSLIHQKLYQEKHLTSVEVKDYFENLIPSIFDSYNISSERVQLSMDVSPMHLDVETLIPIGLIVNELITNALKHGFEDDDQGTIEVVLKEKGNQLYLKVADNGKGMSEHSLGRLKSSFGYELLQSFSDQLDADININNNHGTEVEISINDYKLAS